MHFGVLGSLLVVGDDGVGLDVGGAQPRAVLAMLLAASGRIVPVDTIIEDLWDEQPPASAMGTLQSYISRLRRQLEPNPNAKGRVLSWEPPGYRLDIDPSNVDFRHFEHLADLGRQQLDDNDPNTARDTLTGALALWRGPALLEFLDHDWARPLATRLEERRLTATEDRHRAELTLGRHSAIIGELTELVSQHPLREQLWANLAIALYRSGRQSDALRAIDDMRTTLRDELGIDPSPPIRDLETAILNHDPTLTNPSTPAPAAEPVASDASAPAQVSKRWATHIKGSGAAVLVGRDGEIEAVTAAIDDALDGLTRIVLVEGEAGIGKSALLEHAGDIASERGIDVLWGRCYDTGANPAFWPWLYPLRALNDDGAAGGLDRSGSQLVTRLLATSAARPDESPSEPARFPLFEAVVQLVERASEERPLAIMLEDLHWADVASLELLEYLAGSLIGSRLIVIVSMRELALGGNDAAVQTLATISRRPGARRVILKGLDADGCAELVANTVGRDVPREVTDSIQARADGNPFYIGELARLLADTAARDDTAGRADAAAGDANGEHGLIPLAEDDIPAGVRDVVRRRLSMLPESTTALLRVAAIIGRQFAFELLARAAGTSIDQCLDDLEPAVANRIIVEAPNTPGSFRFAHTMVREVVLDDVSPLRRARFHLRVADAIEAGGEVRADTAEILADHLWRAVPLGVSRRAADALERAADVALRRFALESADDLLERAVQLRHSSSNSVEDQAAELSGIVRLATVRRLRLDYAASSRSIPLERAKELARATGREETLFELLWAEWAGAASACDFAESSILATELLELAVRSADPMLRAAGYSTWGVQCWHEGRLTEAREHFDRYAAERDAAGTWAPGQGALAEHLVLSACFLHLIHALVGEPIDNGAAMTELIDQLHDPALRSGAGVFATMTASITGDASRAVRLGRRAVAEAKEEGASAFAPPMFGGWADMALGSALVQLGQTAEGIAQIDIGLARHRALPVRTMRSWFRAHRALGLLREGRQAEASATIETAVADIAETGERWPEPIVVAVLAEVRAAQGADPAEISALLAKAATLIAQQGSLGLTRWIDEAAARLLTT